MKLTVSPRIARKEFLGARGAIAQAFAESDVCKRHKEDGIESMRSWKKGENERNRIVVFVQGTAAFVGLFHTMAIHEKARLTV